MHNIITKRLILRPPKMSDDKHLFKGLGDYEIAKYLTVPHPYKIKMAQDWLKQKTTSKNINESYFMIELKDNSFVGGIGFSEKDKRAVLSYWLNKQYWAKGFATEASRAIINYYFTNSDAKIIISGVLDFNEASIRIQRKLGFLETGRTNIFCPAQNKNVKNIDTELSKENYEKIANEIS